VRVKLIQMARAMAHWAGYPTLYRLISASGTALLMPGSSGAETSLSTIFCGPLVSM